MNRILLGIACLLALPAAWLGTSDLGWFDRWPSETILFVGNSRTAGNDLPELVRQVADSAGSPVRFNVSLRAFGGASLQSHWESSETQDAIRQTNWDKIVVQAESRAHAGESERNSFIQYGGQILREAKKHGDAFLLVNWTYDPSVYTGYSSETRWKYHSDLQSDHQRLAETAGVRPINVGRIWEDVRTAHPEMN